MPHKLVILSGPSCVGKSPLKHALAKLYPDLSNRLKKLVLYDDRLPRPKEKDGVDYHFRSRSFIEKLRRKKGFLVLEVRGDLMAVDIGELKKDLKKTDVFYEGNPFVAKALLSHPQLKKIPKLSVFLSPISRDEVEFFRGIPSRMDLEAFITRMMRCKLLRRTQRQKGILALPDLENIEIRAKSAFRELKQAWRFDHVIVNHDGEDSDHWEAFYYPIGEARKAVVTFAALLQGKSPACIEKWPRNL